ncbi:PDZ domain-containing protein [Caenorhabditis elegans]|uniref:PDZ domain-containing protein n=1 Tax=Caenorhabditis elegans TaxID=6239 RepID=Q18488_CAEEL|nr:PDZ domain-containing protein [Caenorhabditis elegans]CCD66775.1 PDZ domain-containing protein [Caenorhabditis elegans]|eukprot:NP_498017.1 GIPC (RGS-GAIP Interacting Protein C) homolog [Caenorhabditis elegans]
MQGQGSPFCRSRTRSRSRGAFNRSSNHGSVLPIQPAVLDSIAEESSSTIMTVVNPLMVAARQLKFACQMAHGSPVGIIDKWNNMEELYQSIADCFTISKDDIIFLTVNDFKPDMKNMFTGTLNFKDMLFAHIRGQATELRVVKDAKNFGVTITDNGLGNAFIKVISPDSVFDRMRPATQVGQLIEAVNGECVLGKRHYQVARILKNVRRGEECVVRLIAPKTADPGTMKTTGKTGGGLAKGTIRFKSEGGFAVEDVQDQMIQAEMCGKLNEIFDQYLGVQDDQLAMRIWETASNCETLLQLSEAIKESELSMFDFPDGMVFDMWGIIGDLKREQREKKPSPVMKNAISRPSAMKLFE